MADMNQELAELDRRLDEQLRHQKNQRTGLVVVGVILVVLLLIYFGWISGQVERAAEPEGIAGYAGSQLQERLPEYRENLEQNIRQQAPQVADELITRVIEEAIPQGRQRLEDEAVRQADQAIEQAENRLLAELENHLAQNEEEYQRIVHQLGTEEGKQEFEERVYQSLEGILNEREIQQGLEQAGMTIKYASGTLAYLSDPENDLTPMEYTTKQLIQTMIEMGSRANEGAESIANRPTLGGKKVSPQS